jgi:hypothetical protein
MDLLTKIGLAMMDMDISGIELEPIIPLDRPEDDGGTLLSARTITPALETA